jgi:hypothetical protein
MSILGKIGSAIEGSSLGRVVGSLTDKESYSDAFKSTPLGRIVGGFTSGDKDTADKKSEAAEKISGSPASGLEISKDTLDSLKSIDDNLRNLINVLEDKQDADEVKKQKEEAAAEEQKTEAKALDADAIKPEAQEDGGILKKFGKLAGLVAVLVLQFAYPLYKALMNLKDRFGEGFKKVKDFFAEKILPFFTEDIPKFFLEDIPNFFTVTLPEKFNAGTKWISDKFAAMADLFSGTVAGIKKKIGEFIVGLADKSVFDLFPDAQKKVKSFGEGLVKSGNATISEIDAKRREKERTSQAQAVAKTPMKADAVAQDTSSAKAKEAAASKLTPFEKEFAKQRNIQGPGGVFSWTDPATGKTGTYTTDYKEENPASPVSKVTIENSGRTGKEYGSSPSSDTVDMSKNPAPSDATSAASMKGPAVALPPPGSAPSSTSDGSGSVPVASSTTVNMSQPGGGLGSAAVGGGGIGGAGEMASPVESSASSGNAVADASMMATAPTPTPSAVAQKTSNGMNKSKAPSENVNPVANVPEVDVDLGSISNLWYHKAAA